MQGYRNQQENPIQRQNRIKQELTQHLDDRNRLEPAGNNHFGLTCAVIIGLCLAVPGVMLWHEHHTVQHYKDQTVLEDQKINQRYRDIHNLPSKKQLTSVKGRKKTAKKLPDLTKAENRNRSRLTRGLQMAFNDCHTPGQYDRNKSTIKSYVGSAVFSKINDDIKPQPTQAFRKPLSMANKLTGLEIGYGKVNSKYQVPVNIAISYRTPKFNKNAGAGSSAKTSKKQFHYGHLIINGQLDIATGVLKVSHNFGNVNG